MDFFIKMFFVSGMKSGTFNHSSQVLDIHSSDGFLGFHLFLAVFSSCFHCVHLKYFKALHVQLCSTAQDFISEALNVNEQDISCILQLIFFFLNCQILMKTLALQGRCSESHLTGGV